MTIDALIVLYAFSLGLLLGWFAGYLMGARRIAAVARREMARIRAAIERSRA